MQAVAHELSTSEEVGGVPVTRRPDAGFAAMAYGWATGKDLASLLSAPGAPTDAPVALISAGDFVRNVKQLIDLLRQLAQVLADEATADSRPAGGRFPVPGGGGGFVGRQGRRQRGPGGVSRGSGAAAGH